MLTDSNVDDAHFLKSHLNQEEYVSDLDELADVFEPVAIEAVPPDTMAELRRIVFGECQKIKHDIQMGLKAEVRTEMCSVITSLNMKIVTSDVIAAAGQASSINGKANTEKHQSAKHDSQKEACEEEHVKLDVSSADQLVVVDFRQQLNDLESKQDLIEAKLRDWSSQFERVSILERVHQKILACLDNLRRADLGSVQEVIPKEARLLGAQEMEGVNTLNEIVLVFAKRAVKGRKCTYLKEDTNEWYQTQYRLDKNLENLIIDSAEGSARAEMACPLSDIEGIHALAENESCVPLEVVAKLTPEQQRLLLMVVYRSGQSKLLSFCMLEENQKKRDIFLQCMRILCIYARSEEPSKIIQSI